jgi:carbohydrate kinase (thermoresistant glucokinase family)
LKIFIILMGVSGCGKTTIGQRLSSQLDIPFYEGDDFHSEANVEKMANGVPLTDEDRENWLAVLADLIQDELGDGHSGVLACSALKEKYRQQLKVDPKKVVFIYLKGKYNVILTRMMTRENHYMGPEMLRSQFQTLEEPQGVFTVAIDPPPDRIVDQIMGYLKEENIIEK